MIILLFLYMLLSFHTLALPFALCSNGKLSGTWTFVLVSVHTVSDTTGSEAETR